MYQFFQYLKFLVNSKNAHGIHSPFVYDLLTNCLYDNLDPRTYDRIVDYKKQLLKDSRSLELLDLGAGSKRKNSSIRKVNTIAKHSGSSLKEAKVLYRLSNYLKPKTVLELGTSLGISAYSLSLGNPQASIITVEGSNKLADYSKAKLDNNPINFINTSFSSYLESLDSETFDFIYIDGNHTKQATIDYFEKVLKHTHNDTVLVFDDIYWSKGMTEAWEYIKASHKVSLTIDTFFKGLVFFKKELSKENFKIRI